MNGIAALVRATRCTGCGGNDWRFVVEQNGQVWWRCAACGFLRLIPMADEAAARAEIGGDGIGQSYIASYRTKLAQKMRRSRRRVQKLARRMPGRRLLDVGSNIGCLVEAARRIGLSGVGVEINETLVDFASKTYPSCRFVSASIERAPLGETIFDGIYCSEVIEHVPDQDRFVAALAARLRPRGVLYLTTPHAREYLRNGRRRREDFGAPDHKLYHTHRSLRALLLRHGFASVRFVPTFGRGLKLYATKGGA